MKNQRPRVRVRNVEPLDGFRARITFSDGTVREVDLEFYLHGPVFETIRKDPEVFRAMKVAGGTVAWENGADIDPDVLFHGLKPAWLEESVPANHPAPDRRTG